jgi:DNA-binding Lrp family transcriptional regulator
MQTTAPRLRLDKFDLAILREIQDDGRLSHRELSSRVGLSSTNLLARLRRLQDSGIIKGYRAILDAQKLGYDTVFFITLTLRPASSKEQSEFEKTINAHAVVRESWSLDEGNQFFLKCCGQSLAEIRNFVWFLTHLPIVQTIQTAPVLKLLKSTPLIPFPDHHSELAAADEP